MTPSTAGEAWKQYLGGETLSWCDPKAVQPYVFTRHSQSEWIQMILGNTGITPSSQVRVLEAGCGTGMFGLSLAILGCAVEAFDYNKDALRFAHTLESKVRATTPDIQIQFTQGNLLEIHRETNQYDLVFNQAVLEYFTDDAERRRAFSEMTRVTRSGGWVVVIVQHTGHPFRNWWRRFGWAGYINQPATIEYTPRRLESDLCAAGLTDIRLDGIGSWKALPIFWIPWYKRWRWVETGIYLLGQMLKRGIPLPRRVRCWMGVQILAAGRKP